MPIYEYKCSVCDLVSEEIRKMSDRDNQSFCKICGAAAHHILSSINVGNKLLSERDPPSPNRNSGIGAIQLHNSIFENSNVGVSVPKGARIDMSGNKFINVKKPVEFRDK
jgi:putative FmdB family regulatory protein